MLKSDECTNTGAVKVLRMSQVAVGNRFVGGRGTAGASGEVLDICGCAITKGCDVAAAH